MKKRITVTALFAIYHSLFTSAAFAQVPLPSSPASKLPQSATSLPSTIINFFILPVMTLLGFITVLYIFLAALKFIRSGGDPKAAGEARARLTFAIIGLVVMILAFAFTQIIDKVFLGGTGTI